MSDQATVTAGDKSKGAAYVVANPTEYGFVWGDGQVSGRLTKGGELVKLRDNAPRIVVPAELVPVFVATWGTAIVAKSINGTSLDVSCERIDRDTLILNRNTTNEQLREKLVTSLLFGIVQRSGVVTTKYVVNGVTYTSEEAAREASVKSEREAAITAAGEFLSDAAENGIPADIARNMAKRRWPAAFDSDAQ